MVTVFLAAGLSFVLTYVLGKYVLLELRKLKAGQEIRQDGPRWHASKAGTPTMGGIMFILGTGITVLALGAPFFARRIFVHFHVFLLALTFGLIGFADDYRKVRAHRNEGLTALQKLILQLFAAVVFLMILRFEGFLTNAVYVPAFQWTIRLPWVVYLFFAAFVIVGCVNSVNLTDGVDGLATGVTFVVMIFFTAAGILWYGPEQALLPAALAGGLAAFFLYNRHPAKVFMGDTGSLFLGGAVASLAFAMDMPLILIPVGIIYISETMSDIIQVSYFKATHGKRIFKMAPLHHHLELSGWSEEKLVAVFSAITAAGCVLALLAVRGRFS